MARLSATIASMRVLIVAVLLAGVAWPQDKREEAKRQQANAQIAQLRAALAMYEIDTGSFPTTSQGLQALIEKPATDPVPKHWKGPYVAVKEIPKDPWGREYVYRCPGTRNPTGCDLECAPAQDAAAWATVETLNAGSPIWALAWSPSGLQLAEAGDGGKVRVWSAKTWTKEIEIDAEGSNVYGVCYSRDGARLAAASAGGVVRIWRAPEMKLERKLTGGGGTEPDFDAVLFSPDGKRVVACGGSNPLTVWDVESGDVRATLQQGANARAMAWTPKGEALIHADRGSDLRIIAADFKGEPRVLKGTVDGILCVAVRPDGKRAVTGHWKGQVVVWDLEKGTAGAPIQAHRDTLWGLAFDPAGKRFITGSRDKETEKRDLTVKAWDAETGAKAADVCGHTNSVRAIAFSPDGSMLATASQDGTVRIWKAR